MREEKLYILQLYIQKTYIFTARAKARISDIINKSLTLQLLGMNALYTYVCQSVTVSYVISRASIMIARRAFRDFY